MRKVLINENYSQGKLHLRHISTMYFPGLAIMGDMGFLV